MENNEHIVKVLIENQLYTYINDIKRMYKGGEAEKLVKKYTEDFKETVLREYPVDDIDGLINSTLKRIEEYKERNSR